MRISREMLAGQAASSGFRPDLLEKVARLLGLLQAFQAHPFLKDRLALKGGTALNLFLFNVPRLSVDIDLNVVGAVDRDGMIAQRPAIEQAISAVVSREGFVLKRMPTDHAGGKWVLRYDSAEGQSGNLELDVNFMFRVPLWPVEKLDSRPIGSWRAVDIPVMDVHELAAGKLAALVSRRKARDLFDAQNILQMGNLDVERLRIAFVVYGGMNRKDWRTVNVEDVSFDVREFDSQLLPTLRNAAEIDRKSASYAERLVAECRERLSRVLPLRDSEIEFLNLLLDRGLIDPALLTADVDVQQRIRSHPWLEWKALNVRQHKLGMGT